MLQEPVSQGERVPLYDLPEYVQFDDLGCVGYFEGRWRDQEWKCSLDALHQDRWPDWEAEMPKGRTLAALRFNNMTSEEMLHLLHHRIQWTSLRQSYHVLLIETLGSTPLEVGDLVPFTAKWSRAYIGSQSDVRYMSVDHVGARDVKLLPIPILYHVSIVEIHMHILYPDPQYTVHIQCDFKTLDFLGFLRNPFVEFATRRYKERLLPNPASCPWTSPNRRTFTLSGCRSGRRFTAFWYHMYCTSRTTDQPSGVVVTKENMYTYAEPPLLALLQENDWVVASVSPLQISEQIR